MTTEIQLQIIQIIMWIVGGVLLWLNTRNRRTDAQTAGLAADAKQADAVTALALMNNQERQAAQSERQNVQEQVSVLRETVAAEHATNAALQAQFDKLQLKADASAAQVRSLENDMNTVTQARTADQARINSLEAEIKELNKTIGARDDTIAKQEATIGRLSTTIAELKQELASLTALVAPLLAVSKPDTVNEDKKDIA
jgi:peptidoglycan hydrolase CwlO-like protein